MKIQVRLFSIAKDLAGTDSRQLELTEGERAEDVFRYLAHMNPRFAEWEGKMRLAVNQEYVASDHLLQDGDEVAVIPPVSGG